jgi:hypothetical protein
MGNRPTVPVTFNLGSRWGEWLTLLPGSWEKILIPVHKEAGVCPPPECGWPFWR